MGFYDGGGVKHLPSAGVGLIKSQPVILDAQFWSTFEIGYKYQNQPLFRTSDLQGENATCIHMSGEKCQNKPLFHMNLTKKVKRIIVPIKNTNLCKWKMEGIRYDLWSRNIYNPRVIP